MSDPSSASPRGWTTPADVCDQLMRLWNQGRILAAQVSGSALFPLKLRLRKPATADYGDRFEEVRSWIRTLEQGSRSVLGHGYDIDWSEVRHRQLGRQRVPVALRIDNEVDALRLIAKVTDARRFGEVLVLTRGRFPSLLSWLDRRALTAVECAEAWPRILDVLDWFKANPRSGVYLRQVDIPGVDTKFIEDRRALLAELLDLVLVECGERSPRASAQHFEARYGLRAKPALVRFRLLDADTRPYGLSDLSVPAEEFARMDIGVRRVFITENEVNGLAFPELPDAIVVFGLGYGVDLLKECPWFHRSTVHYWGDIDTHGFAMLDRLRHTFPAVRSLLMDRHTFLEHRALWVREPVPLSGALSRLSDDEQQLFDDLRQHRFGERLRLEQERIGFRWIEEAVARCDNMFTG